MGKTTILQKAHASLGGAFLGVRQFLRTLDARQPAAIEEAFLSMLEDAVAVKDVVIVDDLHRRRRYPRRPRESPPDSIPRALPARRRAAYTDRHRIASRV